MAVDMFMEIATVVGETKDSVFKTKNAIDVLAWSWGMSNSGNAHLGGGMGAGVVNVQDISFTKYMDKASPILMKSTCTGDHFASATLSLRKAGTTPLIYYVVKMTDVLITSLSTGGSGGEDRFTENVTLNFAKFEVQYFPQKQDGTADPVIPMTYDIAGKSV